MAGWSHPRADCCSPCGTCCTAFICPCMTFGNIKARRAGKPPSNCNGPCMGWALLSLCCLQGIYQMTNRSNMRDQYQIQGTCGDDCCSSFCCCCCALVQEVKETTTRPAPVPDSTQPAPQPQMMYSPVGSPQQPQVMYSPQPGQQVAYSPPQVARPAPDPGQGMTATEARFLSGLAQDATVIATTDIKAEGGGI